MPLFNFHRILVSQNGLPLYSAGENAIFSTAALCHKRCTRMHLLALYRSFLLINGFYRLLLNPKQPSRHSQHQPLARSQAYRATDSYKIPFCTDSLNANHTCQIQCVLDGCYSVITYSIHPPSPICYPAKDISLEQNTKWYFTYTSCDN